MYDGDTKVLVVTVTNDGSPVDLTGATVRWIARGKTMIEKSSQDNTINISKPLDGEFMVVINPEDTMGYHGKYYHEAEVTNINGDVSTVLTGYITVKQSYI
jgi:hypothetical protein